MTTSQQMAAALQASETLIHNPSSSPNPIVPNPPTRTLALTLYDPNPMTLTLTRALNLTLTL